MVCRDRNRSDTLVYNLLLTYRSVVFWDRDRSNTFFFLWICVGGVSRPIPLEHINFRFLFFFCQGRVETETARTQSFFFHFTDCKISDGVLRPRPLTHICMYHVTLFYSIIFTTFCVFYMKLSLACVWLCLCDVWWATSALSFIQTLKKKTISG